MKLTKTAAVVVASGLVLAGCSSTGSNSTSDSSSFSSTAAESSSSSSSVTVEDNYGEVTIPQPVERAASTDNRTFEILADWGVPLVAAPKKLIPDTIDAYRGDDVADMGMHREPDMEALVAAQPALIISGQRFSQHYDEMKKLNPDVPIVDFEPRYDQDFFEEMKREVLAMGTIFDKSDEAKQLIADFDKAAERAKEAYDGSQSVMAVNVSGGDIGFIAPGIGRTMGPLYELLGLTPALEVDNASDNHEGDDISVEAIAQSNPEWILVLDRDGAVKSGESDYVQASDIIAQSEALKNVAALKDDHLVYAPKDTYTNESIITYTEILNSMADAFEKAKQ